MATLTETSSPGSLRRLTNRNTNRYSVTALFSMAAEQDADVDDELARGTRYQFLSSFGLLKYNHSPKAFKRS
jgi:hypothetical protein